ncbi:Uridine-cytidine kinase-like [Lachnellula hyalina]|uniref:Uridine kinase n=1 Tax=Lachnellula hyalina TaxID=1316788 RepID=A0A8H8QXH5_9HELO|nr:Uridine-cytidine kinase-like [Lachnellula hyalina]TVY24554.1 Uridine-cytidine kinase-like [Lachnellula hyalina]
MADVVTQRAHYSPPWADVSIIGIAGSSGSGKSTLSHAIVSKLNLPWVVILSMDSFYKSLDEESSRKAFRNEYDFDSPDAIDFDVLVDRLRELKAGKRAEIPIYSFAKHAREKETTSIYSPHVLILEGIFALYDPRVLELLDMKIFCEADADTCLSRRILRDVEERGRDIKGCIKQWFAYVKPNFEAYVEPQRKVADIIVPRGVENRVAIGKTSLSSHTFQLTYGKVMVIQYIERKLIEKSKSHRAALKKLGQSSENDALSENVILLKQTSQVRGMNTIIQDIDTSAEDFIFYFDRIAALLVENALNNIYFKSVTVETPTGNKYHGLHATGETSAVVILRAGSTFETGLRRVLPDCKTGRLLIQSNIRTGEPELHYLKLPQDIRTHDGVLLLDPQMSSGGAGLMAVQVLVDHGVPEDKIVFVTYFAGRIALKGLTKVFPGVKVVVCTTVPDFEERWVASRYLGC